MREKQKITGFISAIRWIYSFGKEYRKWLSLAIISTITLIAANIFKAFYTKEIINKALEGHFSDLFRIIFAFVVLMVFGILSEYISKYTIGR